MAEPTPPDDLHTLAAAAIADEAMLGDVPMRRHEAERYADAALTAVLATHRRQVLTEAATTFEADCGSETHLERYRAFHVQHCPAHRIGARIRSLAATGPQGDPAGTAPQPGRHGEMVRTVLSHGTAATETPPAWPPTAQGDTVAPRATPGPPAAPGGPDLAWIEPVVRRYYDLRDPADCQAAFGLIGELKAAAPHCGHDRAATVPGGDYQRMADDPAWLAAWLGAHGLSQGDSVAEVLRAVGQDLQGCATQVPRDHQPAVDVQRAKRRLFSVLVANAPYLDQPFTDAPECSPWSQHVRPAMTELDRVLKGLVAAESRHRQLWLAGVGIRRMAPAKRDDPEKLRARLRGMADEATRAELDRLDRWLAHTTAQRDQLADTVRRYEPVVGAARALLDARRRTPRDAQLLANTSIRLADAIAALDCDPVETGTEVALGEAQGKIQALDRVIAQRGRLAQAVRRVRVMRDEWYRQADRPGEGGDWRAVADALDAALNDDGTGQAEEPGPDLGRPSAAAAQLAARTTGATIPSRELQLDPDTGTTEE